MDSPVGATSVRCDDASLWVHLLDGRVLGMPLAGFPRVMHATVKQHDACLTSSRGLHWEELDEDISIAGLLAGRADQNRSSEAVV